MGDRPMARSEPGGGQEERKLLDTEKQGGPLSSRRSKQVRLRRSSSTVFFSVVLRDLRAPFLPVFLSASLLPARVRSKCDRPACGRGFGGGVAAGTKLIIAAALLLPLAGNAHAAAPPRPPWQVTITQLDKTGKALTDPLNVTCPQSGCEQVMQLYVDLNPRQFIAAITFVDKGAYVALQPLTPDVGEVIQFEKGYSGPVFIPVRPDEADRIELLRFTLTGPAAPEADQGGAAMMSNQQSLVFHRKLDPDLVLRVELVRPAAAG